MTSLPAALLAAFLAPAAPSGIDPAATVPAVRALGPNLERFDYPFPVQRFRTGAQGGTVEMAYMDVAPTGVPNGRTALLLHGKNFCGATWEGTARSLAEQGYRVIVPDQVGFCKSSKPGGFQYSFAQLAELTRRLLDDRQVAQAVVIGHSLGGMLAVRLALLYPGWVERLVLVNPLGLVDRVAEGVPYADLDTLLREEGDTDAASIKRYQLNTYYHGVWRADYDRWVAMLAGMYAGGGRKAVIGAQARTSEMIATQPVAWELGRLRVPVTFLIGTRDATAFGKARAPAAIRDRIRPIPEVVGAAAARVPRARIVRLEGLGHAPQVEDPARFEAALRTVLAAPAP